MMPSPGRFKSKNKFMGECIRTAIGEGRARDQAIAMCLSMWKKRKKESGDTGVCEKVAGVLELQLEKAKDTKKPTIFLGGSCQDNSWREDIKKEFKDKFFFFDPFDPDWEPKDNIYEELAGITNADYTVFFQPGEGSEKEKEFLEDTSKEFREFQNLEELKGYLDSMTSVRPKQACLSKRLAAEACTVLFNDEMRRIFEAQDDLSGTVHKEKEKRILLAKLPKECEGVKPILIKQGVLKESRKNGKIISYARVRMKQEPGKKPVYILGVKNFPLHQEAETEISKEMFDSFFPDFVDKSQDKKRYALSNGWEIDDINGDKIVAEFEMKGNKEPVIPEDWEVIKQYKM